MLHALDIAGMVCPNNVFLAPMAGYTNLPFRAMCTGLGAGLTFTEMVSAKGLHYGSEETKQLLLSRFPDDFLEGETPDAPLAVPLRGKCPREGAKGVSASAQNIAAPALMREGAKGVSTSAQNIADPALMREGAKGVPVAAQIFGSDPALMREACESEALAPFDLVDINMGCPMPKIVKNGEGSALLEDLPLAEKIISECAKSGKRISVKFRIGVREGEEHAAEYAKRFAGAGACMLTVHGRTREKIYAGPPDYGQIAAAKNAVSVPVIANGGVWNRKDAEKMMERTGADGVMIARAALYNPRVFCEFTGEEKPSLLALFLREAEETRALYGERFALVFMRKMAAFYLRGSRGAARGKQRLFATASTEELLSLARELLPD